MRAASLATAGRVGAAVRLKLMLNGSRRIGRSPKVEAGKDRLEWWGAVSYST